MFKITPQKTILVFVEPVDFRRGVDELAGICRSNLKHDPFSGTLFVFINRPHTAIKIIVYDGQGFCLYMKRISRDRLAWWPKEKYQSPYYELLANQLQILLHQGTSERSKVPENFSKIKTLPWEVVEISESDFVAFS